MSVKRYLLKKHILKKKNNLEIVFFSSDVFYVFKKPSVFFFQVNTRLVFVSYIISLLYIDAKYVQIVFIYYRVIIYTYKIYTKFFINS